MNTKLIPIIIMMSYLCCYATTNNVPALTLPDFITANHRELDEACIILLKNRQKQMEYMISQFNDEKTSIDAKGYIVYLLGKLRYDEAIPFLVEHIDFDAHSDKSRHYYMLETVYKYPGIQSLYELSLPAIKAILTALKTETNPKKRRLLLYTIKRFGNNTGKVFIETELKNRGESSDYIDSVIAEYEAVKSIFG